MFATHGTVSHLERNPIYDGELSNIGEADAILTLQKAGAAKGSKSSQVKASTSTEAIRLVFDTLCGSEMPTVEAVGYRVVHPGAKLRGHQKITPQVLCDLEAAVAFAPLHEPTAISAIREGMQRFPNVDHFACFDTVFHETMPEQATTYPIPEKYRQLGARRYGFHGRARRRERSAGLANLHSKHNESYWWCLAPTILSPQRQLDFPVVV
jgi:acetate kinase